MKLPISDLMENCTAEEISLSTDINTEAVKQNVLARIQAEQPKKKRFKPSVLLVAAAVMTLLVGTAVATTSAMSGRELEDTAETVWYDKIEGTDKYQRVHWPNASYAIDLEIPEDAKSQENIVYYRLGWLPTEFEGKEYTPEVSPDEWLYQNQFVCKDIGIVEKQYDLYRDIILYRIDVSTIQTHEFDDVYYLNGETTLVKQDNWNSWNRMELTVDYTDTSGVNALLWEEPVNYLLLYDSEENILVNICGMVDMETLEQIAENMEIKVSDEPYEYHIPDSVGNPAYILDLSRG